MSFRDPDLNLTVPVRLDRYPDVCSRPPAWWLLKRKKIRDWTGSVPASSTRVDMINLLSPFNSAAYIKRQAPLFADMHAYLLSLTPPRYPFPVDRELAGSGRVLFKRHCTRCHGTYGPGGTYPNRVVPLETIGTDPVLATSVSRTNLEHFNKSWFAREPGPDGKPYRFTLNRGYQAPPLDGVWATGPYFHNGSVPTVYHVLNSRARPKVFTRSFRTGREDYDPARVGWKITVLDRPPDSGLPALERGKVYDTNLRGRSNAGHTFGDDLSEAERAAVIEYLKTL
jgi:mono/diheme cytochrome c family protein